LCITPTGTTLVLPPEAAALPLYQPQRAPIVSSSTLPTTMMDIEVASNHA
jgi:hypothetical protein